MKLFDSHTHLDQYPAEEHEDILARAEAAGVAGALVAGTTLESSARCVAMAERDHRLVAGVGIHPMDVREPVDGDTYAALRELAQHPRVVAISEVGLDGIENAPDLVLQEQVFRAFIRLARELHLPVIYHSRRAYPRTLEVLEEEHAWEVGGTAHYFSQDLETARRCIDLGFAISLARPLMFRKDLQEVVRQIPIGHIVLETDAFPQPYKPKRENWTEPRHLLEVAQTVGSLKGLSVADVARRTSENLLGVLGPKAAAVRGLVEDSPLPSEEI